MTSISTYKPMHPSKVRILTNLKEPVAIHNISMKAWEEQCFTKVWKQGAKEEWIPFLTMPTLEWKYVYGETEGKEGPQHECELGAKYCFPDKATFREWAAKPDVLNP